MNSNDTREMLERTGERVDLPDRAFEQLLRRRDRRSRNRRIGALATVATIGIVFAALVVQWTPNTTVGIAPDPTPKSESDPIVFLSVLAGNHEARNVFAVEANDAEYWRLFTLDTYDGISFTSDDLNGSEGMTLSVPASLPGPESDVPAPGTTLVQTYRILRGFRSPTALPMAQTAESIAGSIGRIRWDPARSEAFLEHSLQAGMTYTIRSRIVVPTPEELDRVAYAAPSTYGHLTALPAGLDPRIQEIAEQWTADATTDYRKVLAIQQRFQEGDFVYNTDVLTTDLVDFLTKTKSGFCQQYSFAMAVMVRTLGLPSRVAVGYRSGIRQEDGSFLVTSADAHSWVEVWFPGYGWLQFEPEAGAVHPNARPGTYLNPA